MKAERRDQTLHVCKLLRVHVKKIGRPSAGGDKPGEKRRSLDSILSSFASRINLERKTAGVPAPEKVILLITRAADAIKANTDFESVGPAGLNHPIPDI